MTEQERTQFQGLECLRIWNPQVSIWITTGIGPRILGLALNGGENLMAVVPEGCLAVEGRTPFSLRGGHRLWYAPEHPLTTYIADDLPVEIKEVGSDLEVIQPTDQPTGIQKSWLVRLDEKKARLEIDHRLTNRGLAAFELAPWAVTMLRTGGMGVLPLQAGAVDPFGVLPNRLLVLWPYTQVDSPLLKITDRALLVKADVQTGALKVGAPNPLGWLAYSYNGVLFVKEVSYQEGGNYPDRGASSQIYCNPAAIELETLGPLVTLEPGGMVEHKETWTIYPEGEWPAAIKACFPG
jgi:hypothetical protein